MMRLLVLAFFVLYIFFAFYIHAKGNPGGDMYPFFSWSLFSRVPNTATEYSIIIITQNGKPVSGLLYYKEKGVVSVPSPIDYYYLVQRFGESIENKNEQMTQTLLPQIEKGFINKPVTFQVVKISFNPFEFYKTKTVQSMQVLATLTTQ